uniref:Uncharacterized protein n=1 Tax=Physcomitrium patens TaxID=3218 RepID=A0A7I3Z1D2_PHYPA
MVDVAIPFRRGNLTRAALRCYRPHPRSLRLLPSTKMPLLLHIHRPCQTDSSLFIVLCAAQLTPRMCLSKLDLNTPI